jgi:hypothetical protein
LHAIPLVKERRSLYCSLESVSVARSESSSRWNESSDDETRGQRSAIRSPSGKRKVDIWSACICITRPGHRFNSSAVGASTAALSANPPRTYSVAQSIIESVRRQHPPFVFVYSARRKNCEPGRKLPLLVDSSKLEFPRRADARSNAPAAGFPAHRAA